MAKQTINIGTGPNTKTGDPLRTAFNKINQNFTELYDADAELVIPTDISDLTDTDGLLNQGGTELTHLTLTNDPFITQPAVLGTPVTITAAAAGVNARFTVDIGEGPTINSIEVTTAGTGYVVGQQYKIWNYDVGGSNEASDIELTIATVGQNGQILTVTDVGFSGEASNTAGTYTNLAPSYLPSVFDEIDEGLVLTRDYQQGLYNIASEQEYDNNNYTSPAGTEWNSDGWGDLLELGTRSYTTWRAALNNQVGNNIVSSELIMHDTINDKYYKFDFTNWGQNNGAFAYTRTEVTDSNYFRKTNYGDEIDVIVEDDGEGGGIGITRGNNNSIYNPYREEGYVEEVSPAGTLWNIDGWDDLTDLESRTFEPFYAAFNGGLGNKVPGSKTIMYVPETDKYYAVEWFSWTQNNQGGGFSYYRREIDLTQLNEGITFADGSKLKSATDFNRIKSTAVGDRRIEEVVGHKTVSVTLKTTNNLTAVASRSGSNTQQVWVDITSTTIDEVIESPQNYDNAYDFEFSIDNVNWYRYDFGYSSDGNERGFNIWPGSLTYSQGDTIYFRYFTGGDPVVWWDKTDLPGGPANFRGAVIDYHAYTGESTIIGTVHIVDDSGEEHISHQEVQSGSTDGENDDLWLVQNEGTISYRRIDGESKTLKVHWSAKVFYGSEFYD